MVKVLPPSPQTQEPLRYTLSEPAYVAAFIVYPGAGVRLIYPTTTGAERLQSAGYHSDPLLGVSFDNDAYRVVLAGATPGPRYLYVVASRNPLDVAQYVHHPTALQGAIGQDAARSLDSDSTIDAIVSHAIAVGGDDSWDSDVYTLYGAASQYAYYDGSVAPLAYDDLESDYYGAIRNLDCLGGWTIAGAMELPVLGMPR